MRPDNKVNKYFLFIFMAAKGEGAYNLKSASIVNLYNASQALFNIYIWMLRAGHKKIFFNYVCVFFIIFTA
jgi:hypothetical protein